MKRNPQFLRRFWIRNTNLSAALVTILLWSQSGFATALVVLVSKNVMVFGADGEGVDTSVDHSNMIPVGTGVFEKIAIVQNRILVSTSGIGRIPGIYDFNAWINSLRIASNASVEDVAVLIQKKCGPVFKRQWDYQLSHGNVPVMNLSGDKSLPMVSYRVGGNGSAGPRIYFVAIYVDWAKKQLKNPTIELLYPATKAATQLKNIFVHYSRSNGGGMDQLFTDGSDVQKHYLKLYDREVGAALYDEPLDVDGMVTLARIMLTVEIEISPKRFSFPIKICSSTPGQRPTCKTYDQ